MARTVSVWPLLDGEAKAIWVAPWIRAVAAKVTGEPERFAPDAVTFCTTESEPVASVVVAIPSAPVVLELEPTVPPPTVGAQVMVTPFTGFPLGSLTITASGLGRDRKSTRLNSSHGYISYAVFCLKKKKINKICSQTVM